MTPMARKVLVVEDDASIRLGLQELLASEGFEVVVCARGDLAEESVRRENPALILLDIMLPRLSGYDLCRHLRRGGITTPILMLTAKGEEIDKVVGLELGADDYVTKPFGVRELIARIHALLRRSHPNLAPQATNCFRIGAAEIDSRTYRLNRDGQVFDLTARELQLLRLFHARAGEVLSRDQLLNEVWGQRYLGTTRTLDQVIVQLRRKLGDSADAPRHLLTVHGVGYRLVLTPAETPE
jgi:DNA-binding response OmpR family regulator